MRIPSLCHEERVWWENLGPHTLLRQSAGSREITFLVEQTRGDCVHACTVDDICHVLSLIPSSDLEFLDIVVLRQSSRKQWLLNPAWGRLAYSAELGQPGRKVRRSGPAVFLEAVNPAAVWKWGKDLSPTDSLEVERLERDGHVVEDSGKRLLFHSSLESVRATQLYRTLLHEIGHWVDWLEKVVRPAGESSTFFDVLSSRYFGRPEPERELFAHQYAETLRKRLTAEGRIPFQRMGDTRLESRHGAGTKSESTIRSHS